MLRFLKNLFLTLVTANNSIFLNDAFKNGKNRSFISMKPLTRVVILLSLGIDGSSLDTHNTFGDALDLISQTVSEIDANIIVKLNKPTLGRKRLALKTNRFLVNLNFKQISLNVKVCVKNVNQGKTLSIKQRIQRVIDTFGTTIEGSKFNSGNNLQSVIKEFNHQVLAIDSDCTISLVSNVDGCKVLKTDKLSIGNDNYITIKITISNKSQFLKLNIINVQNLDLIQQKNAIDKVSSTLSKYSDGTSLNTNNTFHDALILINKQLGKLANQVTISLQESILKNQKLKDDHNQFVINLKTANFFDKVTINLINVALSFADERFYLEQIKESLAHFSGYCFTNDNTVGDAFLSISEIITTIKKSAIIKLETDSTLLLNKGHNSINISFQLNDGNSEIYHHCVNLTNVSTFIDKIFDRVEKELEQIETNLLDTSNTYRDAVNLVIRDIVRKISLELTLELLSDNILVAKTNQIPLNLILEDQSRVVHATIKNVSISNTEWLELIRCEVLENSIKDITFTTSHNKSDVFDAIKKYVLQINEYAIISCVNLQEISNKLKLYYDICHLQIAIGSDSISFALPIENVIKSDFDVLTEITSYLREYNYLEVDGWDSDITYFDVVNYVQKLITTKNVKVCLISNCQQLTDQLIVGNNNVALQLELNEEIVSINLLAKNVKKSSNDILTSIIPELNLSIINWSTDKTYLDVFNFLNEQLQQFNSDIQIKIVDHRLEEKIKVDVVWVDINLILGNICKTRQLKLINTTRCDFDLVKWIQMYDNKTFINQDTSATHGDILKQFRQRIRNLCDSKDASRVSLELVSSNLADPLQIGYNAINLKVKVNECDTIVTLHILDVTKANEQILTEIKQLLSKRLDLKLNTEMNAADALHSLTKFIHKNISDQVTVVFRNKNDTYSPLITNNDEFDIDVKIRTQTSKLFRLKLKNIQESNIDFIERVTNNLDKTITAKTTDDTPLQVLEEVQNRLYQTLPLEQYLAIEVSLLQPQRIEQKLTLDDKTLLLVFSTNTISKTVMVSISNVIKSNNDLLLETIKNLRTTAVTNWNTSHCYQMLFNLIQIQIGDERIKLSLVDYRLKLTDKLVAGTYKVDFQLTLSDATKTFTMLLNDVKTAPETVLDTIKNSLQTVIFNKTTAHNYKEIMDDIKVQLQPHLTYDDLEQTVIKLANNKDHQYQKLNVGDNFIDLKFIVNNSFWAKTVKIQDVILSTNEIINIAIEYFQNNLVFNLSTANKPIEVIALVNDYFSSQPFDLTRINITLNNENDRYRYLTPISDNIAVIITVDKMHYVKSIIKLINIKQSVTDTFKYLQRNLNPNIQGLTTDNTYNDVLDILKTKIVTLVNKENCSDFEYEIQPSLNLAEKLQVSSNTGVFFTLISGNQRLSLHLNILDVKLSANDILASTINTLKTTVSDWDTSKTYQDILTFIKQQISNLLIGVSFALQEHHRNDNLSLDIHQVLILLELEHNIKTVNVVVNVNKLSATALLSEIMNNITTTFTNKTTSCSYLDIVNDVLINLNSLFNNDENHRFNIILENNELTTKKINVGNDTFNIKIVVDNKLSTVVAINTINTILSKDDILLKIRELLEQLQDQVWTTNTSYLTVKEGVEGAIKKLLLQDYKRIVFELLHSSKANNFLIAGFQEIRFKIIVDNFKSETLLLAINAVTQDLQIIEDIIKQINKIDIVNKTTSNTYQDVLVDLTTSLIYDKAIIALDDIYKINNKLVLGTNSIKLKISMNKINKTCVIIVKNVVKSIADQLENIVILLDKVITDWQTNKTHADVLLEIEKRVKNNNIIIAFKDKKIPLKNRLTAKTHYFDLQLFFKDTVMDTTVIVKDVQLTDYEAVQKVANEMPSVINNKTTDETNLTILEQLKNNLDLSYNIELTLQDLATSNNHLVLGDNLLVILIQAPTFKQQHTLKVIGVAKSDASVLEAIDDKLNLQFKGFTTNNTYQDVYDAVCQKINNPNISVSYQKNINLASKLPIGSKQHHFVIKTGGNVKNIVVNLEFVIESSQDIINRIVNKMKKVITNKTTSSSFFDILQEIKYPFSTIDRDRISLQDWTEGTFKLNEGHNSFIVIIKARKINKEVRIAVVDVTLATVALENKMQEFFKSILVLNNINSDTLKTDILTSVATQLEQYIGTKNFNQLVDIKILNSNALFSKLSFLPNFNASKMIFKINLQIINHSVKEYQFNINNITLADSYIVQQLIKRINEIDLTRFTSSSTFNDVLQHIKSTIDNKKVKLMLEDTRQAFKSLESNNQVNIVMQLNNIIQKITIPINNIIWSDHDLEKRIVNFLNCEREIENVNTNTIIKAVIKPLQDQLIKEIGVTNFKRIKFMKPYLETLLLKPIKSLKGWDKTTSTCSLALKFQLHSSTQKVTILNLKNIQWTDTYLIKDVIESINPVITKMTADNSYSDILNQIKDQFKEITTLNFKLPSTRSYIERLKEGNDEFNIIVSTLDNKINHNIKLIAANVLMSVKKLEATMENLMNEGFEASSFTPSHSKWKLFDYITQCIKEKLGADNFARIQLKYVNNGHSGLYETNFSLTGTTNNINVDVTFLTAKQPYTSSFNTKAFGIKWTDEQFLKQLNAFFTNFKYDWNLATNNTLQETLERLQNELQDRYGLYTKKINTLKLKNELPSDTKLASLVNDINNINLRLLIKVVNYNLLESTLKLKNIFFDAKHLEIKILNYLKGEIPSKLSSQNTLQDLFTEFKNYFIDSFSNEHKRITFQFINHNNQILKEVMQLNCGKYISDPNSFKVKLTIDKVHIFELPSLTFKGITVTDEDFATFVSSFLSQEHDWNLSWNHTGKDVLERLEYELKSVLDINNLYGHNIRLEFENPNYLHRALAHNMTDDIAKMKLVCKINDNHQNKEHHLKLKNIKRINVQEINEILERTDTAPLMTIFKDNFSLKDENKQEKLKQFFKEKLSWDISFRPSFNGAFHSIVFGDVQFTIFGFQNKFMIIES